MSSSALSSEARQVFVRYAKTAGLRSAGQMRTSVPTWPLLSPNHCLCRTHIVEAIINSDHDHMLGRHLCFRQVSGTPACRHGHLEVIIHSLGICQLAHG